MQPGYTGRFAPTPSGPLHYGSIIAALAGYLDARHNHGRWLLRIDDLDTPRVRGGAVDAILRTLETFGLLWDGTVLYQSGRLQAYTEIIESLWDRNLLYRCDCTRRLIRGRPYPGTCRSRNLPAGTPRYSLRLWTDDRAVFVRDWIQGEYVRKPLQESGDLLLRRSDGITAYHLANVIDDDHQGVTRVVRGADLLSSTPSQVYLQQVLDLQTPQYAHFPVAVDQQGRKIAKRDQAVDIADADPGAVLCNALTFLGQSPPAGIAGAEVRDILEWAVPNWDLAKIPRRMESEVWR